RKGIIGNLLSPFANLLFLYGAIRYATGPHVSLHIEPWLASTCSATCVISVVQTGYRAHAAASIYGWRFAALAPLRVLWGNVVNFAATATALWDFFESRRRGTGLSWRKTDHVYPVHVQVRVLAGGVTSYRRQNVDPDDAGEIA